MVSWASLQPAVCLPTSWASHLLCVLALRTLSRAVFSLFSFWLKKSAVLGLETKVEIISVPGIQRPPCRGCVARVFPVSGPGPSFSRLSSGLCHLPLHIDLQPAGGFTSPRSARVASFPGSPCSCCYSENLSLQPVWYHLVTWAQCARGPRGFRLLISELRGVALISCILRAEEIFLP